MPSTPLPRATRLGPYEILSPIATGGMGAVYRARDTRLGRDVAVKIIAPDHAADPDRLRRFEREARLASALNHPNIVTIHDIGFAHDVCYIAMEYVDGKPLRSLLRRGPLEVAQLLDIAVQIADGLATAHAAGIVHRDLKPDNVMVRADGCVKILDFGIATFHAGDTALDADTTATTITRPATLLGTPGYMSPEQALGHAVDFRSDQFAFGVMLYEMATGRKPFAGQTVSQALLSIASDEPAPVASLNPKVPAPLRWTIDGCLAKDPQARYGATEDLSRELRRLRDHLSEASVVAAPMPVRRRSVKWLVVSLVLAAALSGFSVVMYLASPHVSLPSFHLLTFRHGDTAAARFAPGGRSIVYAFSAGGQPADIYSVPIDHPDVRPTGVPQSQLLAVSPSGELAVALDWRWVDPYEGHGTLARLSVEAGAPRRVADNVSLADWTPDGKQFAVVTQSADGAERVELPIGRTLYEPGAGHVILDMRVCPRGNLIAMAEVDSSTDVMSILTVDGAGQRRVLSGGWARVQGLAWTSDAREIWFAATKSNFAQVGTLYAVALDGMLRTVGGFPGSVTMRDIAADGRVLLTQGKTRREISGLLAGDSVERYLTWLDYSFPADLSSDGRQLLFVESGSASRPVSSLWLKSVDSPLPVRLGEGHAGAISPGGQFVAALQGPAGDPGRGRLVLIPTGAGREQPVDLHRVTPKAMEWLPDGERLAVMGTEPGHDARDYIVDLRGGPPRPITPEGCFGGVVTLDGKWVLTACQKTLTLFPIDGGRPRSFATSADALHGGSPLAWVDNDHTILVGRPGVPMQVWRLDLETGRTVLWKDVAPADPTGVRVVDGVLVAPGGRAYVSTFRREVSDLYVVDGLR